jgi:hypothetical protein
MTKFHLVTALLFLNAVPAIADVSITSIQVRLYYHESGRFSEPLTGKEALRNVIIGGGDSDEPSNATLITVVVEGPKDEFLPGTLVELRVANAESGDIISKQDQRLGYFGKKGIYRAPFLLTNTGCEPLKLEASVSGVSTNASTTVPFNCGE